MGMPGMTEWLVILAIILVLFGAKKIPELAKGLGTGIKDFKKAIKEDDDVKSGEAASKTKQVAVNDEEQSKTQSIEEKKTVQ